MSLSLHLSDVQRPLSGMSILLTGAETDLGRAIAVVLLGELWPAPDAAVSEADGQTATRPSSGFAPGSAGPSSGFAPGSAGPSSGFAPGSAAPSSGFAPGSAGPSSGFAPVSAGPSAGVAPGSAGPSSGVAPGSAGPQLHLLFGRKRRGPGAAERFRRFCRTSPLAAGLRARFGARPDEVLAGRVVVHEGVPGRPDLGLPAETRAELRAACGVVIVAVRSMAPDGDPAIALAREVMHPHAVGRLFPEALVALVSDVAAVSDAAAGTRPVAEGDLPRHYNPEVEILRLARMLTGDLMTRRAAAFTRARTLGFPSIRGYAAGIGEARFLAGEGRRMVVRTGLLGPPEREGGQDARPPGRAVPGPSAPPGFTTPAASGLASGPLDALHALLELPLRNLPVEGAGRLYLAPVDRSARLVLLAIAQRLEGQGGRVMHAFPNEEGDLTLGRAVTIGQLALRRAPPDPNPLRDLLRTWRVARADTAQAAGELATVRERLADVGAVLGAPDAARGERGLAEVWSAGRNWLARTTERLDVELGQVSQLVDKWLPGRTVAFEPGHLLTALAGAGVAGHPAWARLGQPVDWRTYWLTSALPAALAGAPAFRRKLARRTAGPGSPKAADPRRDGIANLNAAVGKVGLHLLSRLARR